MNLKIKNNLYDVKCVITSKDIQNGMMGKKFNGFDGMLFLMNGQSHSFWMKNCIIPLDIIFIKNNIISKIHHNCEPCKKSECKNYKGNGDMVLEIKGGDCIKYDIKEGDNVISEN